jgi:hypothetical protein
MVELPPAFCAHMTATVPGHFDGFSSVGVIFLVL